MKNRIWTLFRALQEARLRRINERSLAELDAHTLRDIGLHDGADRARMEAARHRRGFGLHFGLF
jgi:hypothetical protein